MGAMCRRHRNARSDQKLPSRSEHAHQSPLFKRFVHHVRPCCSIGDTPSEHPELSVNAGLEPQRQGEKMVRFSMRLLGSVALSLAISGCAMVADSPKETVEATPNVEPALRQAAIMAERNASYGEAAQHYAALHGKY